MRPRPHNILSYGGALLVLLAIYALRGSASAAFVPALLWTFHFARRTAESAWVHRYSGRLVPPSDYLVEYAYYWGFAGWIGYALTEPGFELPSQTLWVGLSLFVVGEIGNAIVHWQLRLLRAGAGSAVRQMPSGGVFRWVACPHYLCELTSWLGFALVCQRIAPWVFFAVGLVILTVYARERHQRYQSEFDGNEGRPLYPAHRRALLPFIF